MPYKCSKTISPLYEIILWPHSSLSNVGFSVFISTTFIFITLPLFAVIGSGVFWGLLPFLMAALWGVWFALRKNYRDREIVEYLSITPEQCSLTHHGKDGSIKTWECNTYWARVNLHTQSGPVPNYVTLHGNGREVEIGSFLSEDERRKLYTHLNNLLSQLRSNPKPDEHDKT